MPYADFSAIERKKGKHLGLPATHLFLIFILLVRAFVRLVASTALVLRPTLSAAEADGEISPKDIYPKGKHQSDSEKFFSHFLYILYQNF